MELKKDHRQALIAKLQECKEQKELITFYLKNKTDNEFDQLREIDMFIVDQTIKLIETSLINNEIDF